VGPRAAAVMASCASVVAFLIPGPVLASPALLRLDAESLEGWSSPDAHAVPGISLDSRMAEAGARVVLADGAGPSPTPHSTASARRVSLLGRFHIIWNGAPLFFLSDDRGQTTRLLLDEAIAKPLGGPLALNGRRVRVTGVYVRAPKGALRVLSIGLAPP